LFGTSYNLAGGQTGTNEEDLSWNYDGTVLATSNLGNTTITRYTAAATGALTSLGDTSVPGGGGQNFPAFNPNPLYAGVMAIGGQVAQRIKIMYFNGSGGTLNSAPTTGFITPSGGTIQVRWSPAGDRIAFLSTSGIRYAPFVYSLGSDATSSFTPTTAVASDSGFDWIYF
jgi:hypothetical protein